MLSRTAMRMPTVANQIVARRTFSSTRSQLASPYHYPEGPRSNLPFNPLTKFFALRFWGFMGELMSKDSRQEFLVLTSSIATGFFLPFGVAGKPIASNMPSSTVQILTIQQSGRSRRTNRCIAVDAPTLAWLQCYLQDAGPSFRMYIIVVLNPKHVFDLNYVFQSICCARLELLVVTCELP